jgi:hydroxymethylpyrimidine/phosphomethylpyrimidine kinase
MRGRVLIVAGSDSGGGAGIQADIKTVTALGGFAATAITALTAQNTLGVHHIQPVDPAFVEQQMVAVLDDIGADIIKIGMLLDAAMVRHVAKVIGTRADVPRVVLDPVMVAKGGASLLEDEAVQVLREQLIPLAWLVTPNIPEAETLTGIAVTNPADMAKAGAAILAMGAKNALIKGGHLEGDLLTDLLVTPQGNVSFEATRIDSVHTHGTGCTLASAIATGLAQGSDLALSVAAAQAYVREAIRTAPEYGAGHGPLNHGHPFQGEA